MRIPSAALFFLAACGGATNEPSGPSTSSSGSPATSSSVPATTETTPSASTASAECKASAPVIAKSGTSVKQQAGSVQRFQLVYQGDAIGVTALRGVDMIIGGSDGPFSATKSSGWWAEVHDPSGKTTFTRILQDPTRVEVPPAPGGGGFTNVTADKCKEKIVLVDVPRAPAGSVLVIFGTGYTAQGPTSELARFTME